ncbi:MAG: type II/IV secretion system protein [Rhizobiaceae bacterium]|jgi:general secretion pathway protein E|nr:type II/IV secretion system protein [Rhizobiaceae bacterium]
MALTDTEMTGNAASGGNAAAPFDDSGLVAAGLLAPEAARQLAAGRAALSAADMLRAVAAGQVDADSLARHLAARFHAPLLERTELAAASVSASSLSRRFLTENALVPLVLADGALVIGAAHPGDSEPVAALTAALSASGRPRPVVRTLPAPDVEALLERAATGQANPSAEAGRGRKADALAAFRDLASGSPVVVAVDDLIARALELRATDIHIEPMRDKLTVRYRIDGMLRELPSIAEEIGEAVVSRIKVLAGLDIAERRKPQDGGMRVTSGGREIEMRVATLAAVHGETVVMRLLQRDSSLLDLNILGLAAPDRKAIDTLLEHMHGLVAVAGPTGSGKTTTLAAALSHLNDPARKIVTIEDPVEYQIPGIVQAQVQPQIGVTFSSAIRSFVRQDPDVILVGEIRDSETAHVAVQAALTGHLVLTTVHANTAPAAFTRLRDLGVETYLLGGAVRGVIAQRLVRRLCDNCKQQSVITRDMLEREPRYEAVGFNEGQPCHHAKGCSRCNDSGYRGRIAVFEVMTLDNELLNLASGGADGLKLEEAAIAHGMRTLADDAREKALAGLTSPEEVIRVTGFR